MSTQMLLKEETSEVDSRPLWHKRRFLLPATAVLAFALGAMGDGDQAIEDRAQQAEARVTQLEASLDAAQARAELAEDELARLPQERETAVAPAPRSVTAPTPAVAPPPAPAPAPAPAVPAPAPAPEPKPHGCDPNYSPCIPPGPPDLDCADIDGPVQVIGSDPHRLDRDGDGVGCESS